ncbi:MAG: hypothetical protein QM796_09265 [Chthoniobacteraceae bacterium]
MVGDAIATSPKSEPIAIPKDFILYAEYGPGYSNWHPWKLTINSDGGVSQEIYTYSSEHETIDRKVFHLTKDDVQQLVALVRVTRFFAIKDKYEGDLSKDPTDDVTLILQVMMEGKSHAISVYAPEFKKNGEVQRFLKLWNEVLRKVPAPNPEQKPE